MSNDGKKPSAEEFLLQLFEKMNGALRDAIAGGKPDSAVRVSKELREILKDMGSQVKKDSGKKKVSVNNYEEPEHSQPLDDVDETVRNESEKIANGTAGFVDNGDLNGKEQKEVASETF